MKRNNIKHGWCTVGLVCSLLLCGCVEDSMEERSETNDGEVVNTVFTLSPDFVEEIEVRSITGVDEKIIKDLWVIQLNADGTGQLQDPQYITTGLISSSSDYKVTIPLLRQASKIYFIANTHNDKAYTTAMKTSADVEAVAMTLIGEADLASADGIPMSGVWTGTPDLLGVVGRVSLSRAIAKVNFSLNASLPAGEVFTLKSITVKQVPNTLNYFRASLENYPYPATPTVKDYPIMSYDNVNLTASPQTLWWYLPENARGTGDATTQIDKGLKFPAGQAAYCTYLEVRGMYEAGNGTYETKYKIYVGANNYNDYNVKRNTVYNVNTTIKGIDAADTRINATEISVIVGLFGGWDESKKEYTNLLEVQTHTKYVTKIWSTNALGSTQSNATNQEYGKVNIDILKPNISNYPAVQYCADLGNGWYLPSQNQLMAIWAAHNGIPSDNAFLSSTYWSSTEKSATNTWYVLFKNGYTDANPKDQPLDLVRCVRDINSPTTVLPMVVTDASNRAIIDARSMPAGAITTSPKARSTKATNSTLTTDNTVYDIASPESNKTVSHYFEVMKIDLSKDLVETFTWFDAVEACKSYDNGTWRLPTQRELMLIWTMHKSLIQKTGLTKFSTTYLYYWGATESQADKSSVVSFDTGFASYDSKEVKRRVRCIRDLTPPVK